MADLKLATKNCRPIESVEKTHATKNEKKFVSQFIDVNTRLFVKEQEKNFHDEQCEKSIFNTVICCRSELIVYFN